MTEKIREQLLGLINDPHYNPLKREELALIFNIHPSEMPMFYNFLDELEYSNDEVDNKSINKTINKCKQIYLHLQVLEHMKDKCYLNKENYIKSKDLYEKLDKNIEIKENVSPVYNFHISRIIEHINEIHDIDVDDNI